MRRALGLLFSGLGGALLLFVGGAYFHGAVARAEARAAWERADARRVAQSADLIRTSATPEVFRPGAPVALLRIPALGLDEVVVEGVGDTQLNAGPGHLPG